jgi:hypothetical protein
LQEEGVDFSEVFAPTAQTASFMVLTSVAAQLRYEMHQIDVSTAFLNCELEEEVYVKLPSSICTSKKVWKLKRALYGLKQAARMWNEKPCKELTGFGYVQSQTDPCLFFKGSGANVVYLLVHVNDAIIVGPKPSIDEAKAALASVFDIKDMGLTSYFLGIEIIRCDQGILLSQEQYTRGLLSQNGFTDCIKGKFVRRAYTGIREYTGIRYSGINTGIFMECGTLALTRYTRVYREAVYFQPIIPHIPCAAHVFIRWNSS